MMIYANGFGVNRDLDISIRLACSHVPGAPAEIEGRLEHLKRLQDRPSTDTFDICDDITSGYMMGYCAGVSSELSRQQRERRLNAIVNVWSKEKKDAFHLLRGSANAFFDERVENEVDQSGTARAAMAIGEEETLEETFAGRIEQADRCAFPKSSPGQCNEADKRLNDLYKKLIKSESLFSGTITKELIRGTQREWIHYRDAWAIYGPVFCPPVIMNCHVALVT
jgi:hypothetical protein